MRAFLCTHVQVRVRPSMRFSHARTLHGSAAGQVKLWPAGQSCSEWKWDELVTLV